MYCDNQSVTENATISELTLSMKLNAICHHKVRESVACVWIRIAWIKFENDLAYLFTKS